VSPNLYVSLETLPDGLPESAPFLLYVIVVFQTAKSVRVVSLVVVVVISFVEAPPRVRLQPPNVYPLRVVVTVRARDSVESLRESRVAVSVAGTEVARVFPSNPIVGLAAVVALAEDGIAIKPAMASKPVRTTAVDFLDSDMILELRTVAMGFPSMIRYLVAKSNFRPTTTASWVPTGCE
jgi:hypothetical protein